MAKLKNSYDEFVSQMEAARQAEDDARMGYVESAQIGNILSAPRSPTKYEILSGVKPTSNESIKETFTLPAKARMEGAADKYKDVLQRYKMASEIGKGESADELARMKIASDAAKTASTDKYRDAMLGLKGQDVALSGAKLALERSKAEKEITTPKLGATEKEKLGIAQSAYKAVEDMNDAITKNVSKISLIGDNDYTMAQRTFAEMLGRLQSGGAINKDEEARFKKMTPTILDSKDIAQKKINNLRDMIGQRIKLLSGKDVEISKPTNTPKLEIGMIEDGFKFKGGDPANKANWEAVNE